MTEFRLRCPDWWSPISGLPHHRLINIVGHVYVWRGKERFCNSSRPQQVLKTPKHLEHARCDSATVSDKMIAQRFVVDEAVNGFGMNYPRRLLNFTASQLMGFPYGSMPHGVPSIETTEPCESNLGTKFEVVTNI
ncbi:hypothetical protein DKX38_002533 [Salix brachista]|uniref:Uncharacterized protein n=1 Tax=Salix brachista TaxID=2182728 RepID=A0A5N5NMC9_9ROSI|nr:hypothetical protein DKX38_002533 [Salix brachista]